MEFLSGWNAAFTQREPLGAPSVVTDNKSKGGSGALLAASARPGSLLPGGAGLTLNALASPTVNVTDSIVWGNRITGVDAGELYET